MYHTLSINGMCVCIGVLIFHPVVNSLESLLNNVLDKDSKVESRLDRGVHRLIRLDVFIIIACL